MKKDTSDLLEALEEAILRALADAEGKERTDVITAGIKLLAIRHRIRGSGDTEDYFGGS